MTVTHNQPSREPIDSWVGQRCMRHHRQDRSAIFHGGHAAATPHRRRNRHVKPMVTPLRTITTGESTAGPTGKKDTGRGSHRQELRLGRQESGDRRQETAGGPSTAHYPLPTRTTRHPDVDPTKLRDATVQTDFQAGVIARVPIVDSGPTRTRTVIGGPVPRRRQAWRQRPAS